MALDMTPEQKAIGKANFNRAVGKLAEGSGQGGQGVTRRQFMRGLVDEPTVLPAMVLIGDELAARINASTHLGKMCGAVIVPTELVPAHEMDAHRLAHGLRHNCCRLRSIFVAAASEGAGAFMVAYAHILHRQSQDLGEHRARVVDVLG